MLVWVTVRQDRALKATSTAPTRSPASTHPDTLRAIVAYLQQAGARESHCRSGAVWGHRANLESWTSSPWPPSWASKWVLDEEPLRPLDPHRTHRTHWLRGFYSRSGVRPTWSSRPAASRRIAWGHSPCRSITRGLVAKRMPGGVYDTCTNCTVSLQRLMIGESTGRTRWTSRYGRGQGFVDGGLTRAPRSNPA